MNREIKFRGWDNGMWPDVFVSGDLWTDNICEDRWHSGPIMQYTGLKDKNNKDIYEGDKTWDGFIEFNVGTCCYIIRRANGTFIRLDIRKDNVEIIGNIYES